MLCDIDKHCDIKLKKKGGFMYKTHDGTMKGRKHTPETKEKHIHRNKTSIYFSSIFLKVCLPSQPC